MKLPTKIITISGGLLWLLPLVGRASSFTKQYDQLYNPLPSNELICPTVYCDLSSMFLLIIRDILQIIPVLSVLVIIVGGFRMIMSQGNEEQLLRAKRTIYWAIGGLAVAFLSFSIIAIVRNLLGVDAY